MAQRRPRPGGEHHGHAPPVRGERRVADGVDPAVDAVKATRGDPRPGRAAAHPQLDELADPRDALLALGQVGQPGVERGWVEFRQSSLRKSTHPPSVAAK
jgi:hypothetical protein